MGDFTSPATEGPAGASLVRLRQWLWRAMREKFLAGDRAGLRGLLGCDAA